MVTHLLRLAALTHPACCLTVTVSAIYRPVRFGLEWHLGLCATLGTYRREHLPLLVSTAIPAAARTIARWTVIFTALSTGWTTLRVVGVALLGVVLLVLDTEGK